MESFRGKKFKKEQSKIISTENPQPIPKLSPNPSQKLRSSLFKSLGQAFSKACGVKRQSLCRPPQRAKHSLRARGFGVKPQHKHNVTFKYHKGNSAVCGQRLEFHSRPPSHERRFRPLRRATKAPPLDTASFLKKT